MATGVEQALEWIMSSKENLAAFRADANTVLGKFQLSDSEKEIIRAVHAKGMNAEELEDAGLADVQAQRSYGWGMEK